MEKYKENKVNPNPHGIVIYLWYVKAKFTDSYRCKFKEVSDNPTSNAFNLKSISKIEWKNNRMKENNYNYRGRLDAIKK